jgi:hypothetical protein
MLTAPQRYSRTAPYCSGHFESCRADELRELLLLVFCTRDLRARLIRHNNGDVTHTSKWKPWRIKTYIAFSDQEKARSFESYLKTSSGRAFQKKRL